MSRYLRYVVFGSVAAAALLFAVPSVADAHSVRVVTRPGVWVERGDGPVVYEGPRYRYYEPGYGYYYYYPRSGVYIGPRGYVHVRPFVRGGGVDVGPLHVWW